MVRNQHQLPSRRIEFTHRTYFVRPKTFWCQQLSSQYPIFLSQARDQSFSRVARNETKYQKILDAADFASRENCSFHDKALGYFPENFVQGSQKTVRQPTMRERGKRGGGLLIASEKLIKVYLQQLIQ